MLTERRIPARLSVEVYVNQAGTISIKQEDPFDESSIIVVHPDDVQQPIRFLEVARQEAVEAEANADADDDLEDVEDV